MKNWRLKTNREKIETIIIYVVFALYALFLFKLLLFSRVLGTERLFNLIPFKSITKYIFNTTFSIRSFAFSNVVGNIAIFIPLGAYLSLFTNKKPIKNMLLILFLSLSVEIIQGIFALGASDIDDVILNGLGGLIGILGFKLIFAIVKEKKRVNTVIAALSIIGAPILYYYLFMIKLRL